MAVNDKRRTDVRHYHRLVPYWIESAEFGYEDTGDDVILFGFPAVAGVIFIHEMIVHVTEAFSDSDGISGIGYATVNAAGTLANKDADQYMAASEITANQAGRYVGGLVSIAHNGSQSKVDISGTDWAEARFRADPDGSGGTDKSGLADLIIVGADYDTMPVIIASVKSGQTAGKARLYVLISRID